MTNVARLSDSMSCGDVINEGSGNVFAEGLPVSRIDKDLTAGHCFAPATILVGSSNQSTVFVNNIPVVIKTDLIDNAVHKCPPVTGAPHPPLPPCGVPCVITGAATVFAYA